MASIGESIYVIFVLKHMKTEFHLVILVVVTDRIC